MSELIGSAGSLEGLVALIKSRMFWSTVILTESGKGQWSVASGNGVHPGLRVVVKANRYRLERATISS